MLLYNGEDDPILNSMYIRFNLSYFEDVIYKDKPENFQWVIEPGMGHIWSQNFQKLFKEFMYKYMV